MYQVLTSGDVLAKWKKQSQRKWWGATCDMLVTALIDVDTRRSLVSTEQSNHVQPDSRGRETQVRANDRLSSLVGDQVHAQQVTCHPPLGPPPASCYQQATSDPLSPRSRLRITAGRWAASWVSRNGNRRVLSSLMRRFCCRCEKAMPPDLKPHRRMPAGKQSRSTGTFGGPGIPGIWVPKV